MTEGKPNRRVVVQRAEWVRRFMQSLEKLPLTDKKEFFSDDRNIAAAESYLRRALEGLFDLGRHILVKRFGRPATEYKEIVAGLKEKKIISAEAAALMREMAGYRNRMVHFYHEITPDELYEICSRNLEDIEKLLDMILAWVRGDQNWK